MSSGVSFVCTNRGGHKPLIVAKFSQWDGKWFQRLIEPDWPEDYDENNVTNAVRPRRPEAVRPGPYEFKRCRRCGRTSRTTGAKLLKILAGWTSREPFDISRLPF